MIRWTNAKGEPETECVITLGYLASPFSKAPGGILKADADACRLAGALGLAGLHVYSPIAYGMALCRHSDIDPLDLDFWLPYDSVMMTKCDALVVAHLPTWEISRGIQHEVAVFKSAGKPIFDLDPESLTMARRT